MNMIHKIVIWRGPDGKVNMDTMDTEVIGTPARTWNAKKSDVIAVVKEIFDERVN